MFLFAALRWVIGDPFCLFLMMSTNAILALNVTRRYDDYQASLPGARFLAWMTLFGTIFTFSPAGIGFFATMVPILNNWPFFVMGAICVCCAIRAIWQSYTLPKSNVPLWEICEPNPAFEAAKARMLEAKKA